MKNNIVCVQGGDMHQGEAITELFSHRMGPAAKTNEARQEII